MSFQYSSPYLAILEMDLPIPHGVKLANVSVKLARLPAISTLTKSSAH